MIYVADIIVNGASLKSASVATVKRVENFLRNVDGDDFNQEEVEEYVGGSGYDINSQLYRIDGTDNIFVKLSDLVSTDTVVDVGCFSIDDVDDKVLGVAFSTMCDTYVASFTLKELRLLDFIESVEMVRSSAIEHDAYAVVGSGVVGSGKCLFVNTSPVSISILDLYGTVFELDNNGSRVLNLWDLLLFYCKGCGINIMQYPIICLGSGEKCVRIKLSESTEANRFFMKMAMGATK